LIECRALLRKAKVEWGHLAFTVTLLLSLGFGDALADAAAGGEIAPPALSGVDGPSPYPSDPADWAGKGAIRVFGWMSQNREAFWRERAEKQHAVVFAGDSLVGGWKTLDRDFPGMKTANRGIGGDVSRGLLFRWKEDVLDLHPKAVVVLIGTNDLSAQQATQDTATNIALLLDAVAQSGNGVPVILCTLPPRNNPKAPLKPGALDDLNRKIEALGHSRKNVQVLDLHALFATRDGSPEERYFQPDQLHLNPVAYSKWHEALQPMLEKLNVH
jgi:lysophospholipase L1-like esterase